MSTLFARSRLDIYWILLCAPTLTCFHCVKNGNLDEYSLLWRDLKNFETVGYKSSFHNEPLRATHDLNLSQGALRITDHPFDVGILGPGFFKVRVVATGRIGYTRAGAMAMDRDRRLVNQHEGWAYTEPLLPSPALENSHLLIDSRGNIVGKPKNHIVGRLSLYLFENAAIVTQEDALFFLQANAIVTPIESKIASGVVETSNVEVPQTIARMQFLLEHMSEREIPNLEFKKGKLKDILTCYSLQTIDEQRNKCVTTLVPFVRADY